MPEADPHTDGARGERDIQRRHLVFGWWSLLGFVVVGMGLEAMHGFKAGWYLDAGQETRRLLLTLAHAHGVLLALTNVAFAATLGMLPGAAESLSRVASPCLLSASLLMPAGFLAGGIAPYGGDPGLGILLVLPGAALLFVAVAATAASLTRSR